MTSQRKLSEVKLEEQAGHSIVPCDQYILASLKKNFIMPSFFVCLPDSFAC